MDRGLKLLQMGDLHFCTVKLRAKLADFVFDSLSAIEFLFDVGQSFQQFLIAQKLDVNLFVNDQRDSHNHIHFKVPFHERMKPLSNLLRDSIEDATFTIETRLSFFYLLLSIQATFEPFRIVNNSRFRMVGAGAVFEFRLFPAIRSARPVTLANLNRPQEFF